jgi:2-polyprenyl-6-methoxyphenol hydroxylase-like FAD-dependent oxidoreductase
MATRRTAVAIVGAGPTGLTAAARLAALGVDHVVLDARAEPTATSNAALVHASALELLAELAAADELVAAGNVVRRIVLADDRGPFARIGLTDVDSTYPFALGVPQSTTERILLARLGELGGAVRRSHRVETLRPAPGGHLIEGTADGGPFTVHARYVIGADGAHSAIRAAAGLTFPGEQYPDQFVLADVALTAPPAADDEAAVTMSPDGVTVVGRLPGGTHRIIATVAGNVPPAPDRSFVDNLLERRGLAARTAADPLWSSRFRVQHRVADRFRAGDVFLAGDAAHVHSPAAGQGMNTGIADGFDLATRLAAVVGGADPALLDGYETDRRAAAAEVLRFTDRMTRAALLRNPVARRVRRVMAGTLTRVPPVRDTITMWVTGLRRSPLHQA